MGVWSLCRKGVGRDLLVVLHERRSLARPGSNSMGLPHLPIFAARKALRIDLSIAVSFYRVGVEMDVPGGGRRCLICSKNPAAMSS